MSFRCFICNKVAKQGRMVLRATHEVVQYDHFHKREVRTNEIASEARACEGCAAELDLHRLDQPEDRKPAKLGKVRTVEEAVSLGWLEAAIEANAPEEE